MGYCFTAGGIMRPQDITRQVVEPYPAMSLLRATIISLLTPIHSLLMG